MKKGISLVACFTLILNSGCASIVKGTRQDVRIETNPPGATVFIERTHESMITPATLVLKKKHEYELKIEKPGYKTEYVQIDRHLSGWFWGNLIFGGLIGIIVDLTNGAGYKLEPKESHVELQHEAGEVANEK